MNRNAHRVSRGNAAPEPLTAGPSRSSVAVSVNLPDLEKPEREHDDLLTSILQTGARLQNTLDKHFLPHGLTMLDAIVVLSCVEAARGVTPGTLAVVHGRDKGKITRVVDRLLAKGFVIRSVGRRDRRISLIKPTPKAKKAAPLLVDLFIAIRHQLFAEMPKNDLEHVADSLVRLCETVKGIDNASRGRQSEPEVG
jgi:DNA-binding MarR family transcriptional regulator